MVCATLGTEKKEKCSMSHQEDHKSHRNSWLRAAVLGANDGIVSTASLIIGVAAANTDTKAVLLAGIAGLVAGAMSMAAGEYVSVSSQADTEQADLELERESLEKDYEYEKRELTKIYVNRGLSRDLAKQVAAQLMEHDALGAHARDEIGITEIGQARPILAAISSAATFTIGAALPLIAAWLTAKESIITSVAISSLLLLAVLGGLAAKAGGAPIIPAATRVTFWGALAMLLTAGAGLLFGATG